MRFTPFAASVALLVATSQPATAPRWGAAGHEMAARAAVDILPPDVPGFFRAAGDELVFLNPEPDRWRDRTRREMDEAWTYDHYIDLENVPEAALAALDRFSYLDALREAGVQDPERDGGLLPFRIVELYQRLVVEWRLWRGESNPVERTWIEHRIVNDAGILGHYVVDASQPHHTTIHFNGWSARQPNPEGYTLDRTFHARFESDFVNAHVRQQQVSARVQGRPRSVAGQARSAVIQLILASHARVEDLYRLDRDFGFDPVGPASAEALDFTVERLAQGSRALADLWWSAWLESASAE